jgi:hypothetical protein
MRAHLAIVGVARSYPAFAARLRVSALTFCLPEQTEEDNRGKQIFSGFLSSCFLAGLAALTGASCLALTGEVTDKRTRSNA